MSSTFWGKTAKKKKNVRPETDEGPAAQASSASVFVSVPEGTDAPADASERSQRLRVRGAPPGHQEKSVGQGRGSKQVTSGSPG